MASDPLAAWDDIDPGLPIEERMVRLEEMMRSWRDSEAAATYLQDSVDRLGLNATALGEALLQVDRNQQALTRLGKELKRVDDASATKEDLEAAAQRQREATIQFRKNTLSRIYTTATVMGIALLVGGAIVVDRQQANMLEEQQKCLATRASTTSVQAYVTSQRAIELENRFIDDDLRKKRLASLDALGRAFPIPECEANK